MNKIANIYYLKSSENLTDKIPKKTILVMTLIINLISKKPKAMEILIKHINTAFQY